MKKFNISVNGNSYMVEVEEIKEGIENQALSSPKIQPQAPKSAPSVQTPKQSAPSPSASISASEEGIKAPMPGTVNDIKVSQGQQVKAGDVLLILEAMKMENEIMTPKDGVVKSIHTTKGSSVNTGDVLIVVE